MWLGVLFLIILTGLLASIGVTYSSCPFLRTLSTYMHVFVPRFSWVVRLLLSLKKPVLNILKRLTEKYQTRSTIGLAQGSHLKERNKVRCDWCTQTELSLILLSGKTDQATKITTMFLPAHYSDMHCSKSCFDTAVTTFINTDVTSASEIQSVEISLIKTLQ